MAWATKYQFKFDSAHGVEHRILIQKDGYSGEIIKRRLGRGPVLKKQKNGPICGTSLEIYAECVNDGEFANDFFTSNPKELRARLYRGNTLIWTGFVSTETYSEPNIAPPYDVQIVATDGLGELKLVTFEPAGAVTLSQHFRTALSYAGESHTIYVASALIMTGQATTATFGMSINLDYMADKSYYEVLTALLDSLHATITMYNGNWLIARETDLSSLLSGSGLSVVSIAANGTVGTTTLSGVAKTVGSLADDTKDTWPVGYLSTAIEPARREVTVEAPWHTVSGPADPSMEATTGSPWTTEGQVTHDTTDDCYYELGLNQSDPLHDKTWGTIKQEIPINKLDCGFELKLRVAPRVYKLRQGDTQWYARGIIKVHLEYVLTQTQGGSTHTMTYIGTEEGWSGAPKTASDPAVDIPVTELDSIGERWLSVDIPAIATPDSSSRYLVSDTALVRIVIEGYWVDVYECIMTPTLDLPGYQDIIVINNGARGAENAVEITGGRVRSDNLVNNMFYGGIWLYGGVPVTSFADSQNQGGDFLAIAALSYASSAANARLRTEGSINVPAGFTNLPLFLTVEDVPGWLETWDWDLMEDEVQISLLSLPANQITVESETVTGLPEGYSGSAGGGTGTGSSAASAYSYKSGGSDFFEEDGEGGVKLKDEYNGLWAQGFISAGGIGSSGGSGGGIDLGAMWTSLRNTPTATSDVTSTTKIAVDHIPDLSISKITGLSALIAGLGTTKSLTVGSTNYTPDSSGVITIPAYPTTLPASDVYAWAKAATKPSYTFSELTSHPSTLSGYGITDAAFGTAGTDYVPVTLGSTTKNVLTAHQSLVGLATETWVGQQLANYLPLAGGNMTGSVTFNHNLAIYFKNSSGTAVNALSVTSNVLYVGSASLPSYHYGSSQEFYYGSTLGFKLKDTGRLVVYGGLALSDASGSPYLDYDSTANAWHLHGNLYADGTLTAGGIGGANNTLVTIDGAQTITGAKTFSAASTFNNNVTVDGSYTLAAPAFKANTINPASGHYINMATSGGYVSIGGTTTSTSYKLYVTGSAYATGAFINGSDARLKENILEINPSYALEKIMRLRPVSWSWNSRSRNTGVSCGFIAQDVDKVLPEMVRKGGEYLGLEYTMLHAFEVSTLQDHERRIRELENENKELKMR